MTYIPDFPIRANDTMGHSVGDQLILNFSRYAYGCAFSSDYTECTLRTLLDNADSQMYHNKRAGKLENNKAGINYL